MKIFEVYYTPRFLKRWRRVPNNIKKKAVEKERLFLEDSFHPLLKTHKLAGKLENHYSFSIDYHWRIVFHIDKDVVYFDSIGTHAVYR